MARTPKTPKQRALEAVDAATRRVARLRKQREDLDSQIRGLRPQLAEAEKRLEYARQDPALGVGQVEADSS